MKPLAHPPRLDDYLHLFALYPGVEFWSARPQADGDPYLLLFRQVMRYMAMESAFNTDLPSPFRKAARGYMDGAPDLRRHFQAPDNRNFLLSDLLDWLHLQQRRRKRSAG